MHYLLYYAFEAKKLTATDLQVLLEKAVEKNAKLNITGLLLYVEGAFIQLIEGEKETVLNLFEEISNDKRIIAIKKVTDAETDERYFKDWAMAFDSFDLSVIKNFEDISYPDVKAYLQEATSMKLINLMLKREHNLHLS